MTLMPETVEVARTAQAPHVTVASDRCAGCQECVVRCPTGALTMDHLSWTVLADDGLCVGCRQCVRTCPFAAIEIEGPLLVSTRVAVALHHATELPGNLEETRPGILSWADALAETRRCLSCPDPTCVRGCPVHNDIPRFIAAVGSGDLDEAHRVLRRTTFLPDVCSRVCDQAVQCEGSCTWSLAGGTPVAIGALERFITDNASIPPLERTDDRGSGLKVAVVGSGPAAIGAAFELVRSGAEVTVLEKDDRPGGLLRWGIPEFTLPRQVSERPWEALRSSGVTVRCGVEVTPEGLEELRRSYDAVVLAHGATKPLRLPVEGGDLDGVCDATEFLQEARSALAEGRACSLLASSLARADGEAPRVLVLGAGNTAMDVARLARRLGARATCIDWMDRRFAPVRPDELDEAEEEGVDIRFSTTLRRLEGVGGRVTLAYVSHTRQKRAGRPPRILSTQVASEAVDLVVMAMGYRMDPSFGPVAPTRPVARHDPSVPDRRFQASGLLAGGAPSFARHRPVGTLALGREIGTVAAGLGTAERVWVAGDALVGPSTVVEAMAQGRRAAQAILAGQPSATSKRRPGKVATALVTFDHRGGQTEALARRIAGELTRRATTVRTLPLAEVTLAEVAAVDLVVLGSSVRGLLGAGAGPSRVTREWLDRLPGLGATTFATFCSYGVAQKGSLAHLRRTIEAKGGQVVAEGSFGPRDRSAGAPERFALAALSGVLGEPGADEVVAEAIAALERSSGEEAAKAIAHFAGQRSALLAKARQQLVVRLRENPGDIGASRALTAVAQALSGLAERHPQAGQDLVAEATATEKDETSDRETQRGTGGLR